MIAKESAVHPQPDQDDLEQSSLTNSMDDQASPAIDPPQDESSDSEGASLEYIDSGDDFISSGDEACLHQQSSGEHHASLSTGRLAQHTSYFERLLNESLDSTALDNSLRLQAQLSGQLNDVAQRLVDKEVELCQALSRLKEHYKFHFTENRIANLESDLDAVTSTIARITKGSAKSLLFGRKVTLGVADRHPIEYNRAKEKVLERSEYDN